MRGAALLACVLVACADPPPPSAPVQPAASLDIPPMPPQKVGPQKSTVAEAPLPGPADDDDASLPYDTAAAEKEFEAGRRAAQTGDWAMARKHFLMSLRYDRAVGTLLNLATVEERLGDKPSAIRHYQAAYDECTRRHDTARAALAKDRLDTLRASP